jgi:predicted nuclease of restriction endonuclease-like (RecB) superfamily
VTPIAIDEGLENEIKRIYERDWHMKNNDLTFDHLLDSILQIHKQLASQAGRAVNISLTLRNWMIGLHIAEFQLHGKNRAVYGDNLLHELSKELIKHKISNTGRRQLYNYLSFYRTYPQIVRTVPAQSSHLIPASLSTLEKVRTPSAQLMIPPEKLLNKLSYSHLEQLVKFDEEIKRTFYEIECIRGNWSVRELKRQINSLYYERSGLSKNKEKLAELVRSGAESAEPELSIRDPYIFEFLGLKPHEVMSESALEDQLLDKLQEFLLEMGHGFCFEARQKRILIGDTHNFVDLVFYHRILKCHVLVELKVDEFSHEHIGQLNTYISWYKKNETTAGDNPPVGILLCTRKDHPLVEYALAGMDNQVFVSKYQLELPKTEDMQRFLAEQIKEVGHGE